MVTRTRLSVALYVHCLSWSTYVLSEGSALNHEDITYPSTAEPFK